MAKHRGNVGPAVLGVMSWVAWVPIAVCAPTEYVRDAAIVVGIAVTAMGFALSALTEALRGERSDER